MNNNELLHKIFFLMKKVDDFGLWQIDILLFGYFLINFPFQRSDFQLYKQPTADFYNLCLQRSWRKGVQGYTRPCVSTRAHIINIHFHFTKSVYATVNSLMGAGCGKKVPLLDSLQPLHIAVKHEKVKKKRHLKSE